MVRNLSQKSDFVEQQAATQYQGVAAERRNMNSRDKGKRGELELSHKLQDYGYCTRRGQQFCGLQGDADVVGLVGVHIECKRVEKLNIYDAMSQAKRDAKDNEKPTVFHRKNNCEWLVTMRLDDWIELYREWEAGNGT